MLPFITANRLRFYERQAVQGTVDLEAADDRLAELREEMDDVLDAFTDDTIREVVRGVSPDSRVNRGTAQPARRNS